MSEHEDVMSELADILTAIEDVNKAVEEIQSTLDNSPDFQRLEDDIRYLMQRLDRQERNAS